MAEAFASACGGDTRTALIEIAPLLALPEEAAVRALQFLQQRIGGRMLERPHLEAVFALCRSKDPSAQTHLPGSRACRRYGTLLLTVEAPEEAPAPCTVRPGETVGFGPWEVTLLPVEGECPPLTLRSRLPGDMIAMPYGSKSVKKLLIEKKVPKELRETIPILCDRENILAVASLCRAHLPDNKIPQIICRRKKI